jgi:hypothetical protein
MVSGTTSQSFSGQTLRRSMARARQLVVQRATREAGPRDVAPSYEKIDASPINQFIMARFRTKMIDKIGEDVDEQGYAGIMALTRKLNSMYKGMQGLVS